MKTAMLTAVLIRMVLILWVFAPFCGAAPEDATYIIRPNDSISLAIYEEPDLSVKVRILKTGQASFPLIGSVEIAGLSVAAAAQKIRDLYAKDYLVNPRVTLTVDDYAAEFISVIGAVKAPGQIPIPVSGILDMATAMTSVGGLTEDADTNGIRLIRASGTTSSFSMASIQGEAGRLKLAAGDRIIVAQSTYVGRKITILGQVGRPGPMPFPASGKLDLVNAISLAGGTTDLANPKKVTINRKGQITIVDFKEISQRGDRPFLLQPDDVITVAERFF